MSEDLERILAQFLKVNRCECCYKIYETADERERMKKKFEQQVKKYKDWDLGCMVEYMCCRFHKYKGMSNEQIKQMKLNLLKKKKKELENELKNVQPSELKTEEKTITRDKKTITKELKRVTTTLDNIKNGTKEETKNEDWSRKQKIFPVIWNKFEEFRETPNIR
eukprot:142890_1